MIYELLKEGRENALSPQYLQVVTGLQNEREVRRQVEAERLKGNIIISNIGGSGGYYRPATTEEVRDFIRTYEYRARATIKIIEIAKLYLRKTEGMEVEVTS